MDYKIIQHKRTSTLYRNNTLFRCILSIQNTDLVNVNYLDSIAKKEEMLNGFIIKTNDRLLLPVMVKYSS